jgi:transposase-like protein
MIEKEEVRKRKHFSPEQKYQIFLEAVKAEGSGGIGEVIRRHGIHSSDLQRIRRTVEEGAIQAFKDRKSRKQHVSLEDYKEKEEDVKKLESIVLEQAAEIVLLKKKTS